MEEEEEGGESHRPAAMAVAVRGGVVQHTAIELRRRSEAIDDDEEGSDSDRSGHCKWRCSSTPDQPRVPWRRASSDGRWVRAQKLQGWPKIWANLRLVIGIYSQNLGPT